jgi:hypothetical protein
LWKSDVAVPLAQRIPPVVVNVSVAKALIVIETAPPGAAETVAGTIASNTKAAAAASLVRCLDMYPSNSMAPGVISPS